MPPSTPRVFIIRHGETEWSLDGRHTGVSDIPLTVNGERRIRTTGRALFGPDRLIVPKNLAAVWVSPRKRARKTLELLVEEGCEREEDEAAGTGVERVAEWERRGKVEVREEVREWDYGDYEGVKTKDIQKQREEKGIPGKWDIWRDGCPSGESPEQVVARLDAVIKELRERHHAPAMKQARSGGHCAPSDVLVVAHGHILRSFAARWVGKPIADNPSLILEAGGVGTLSYEHDNIDEPAILLGGAFVVHDN